MKEQPTYRVLTLSTTFPNPAQPTFGVFVRTRAASLGRRTDVSVVAPVSVFNGLSLSRAALTVPRERKDGTLTVFHPRWVNVPGGAPINALLLAAAILLLVLRLRSWRNIDVLDAHFAYIDGVAACIVAAVLRKPFMLTLRGSEIVHAKYRMRRLVISWALRRAAAVIAVSSELRQLALKLGAKPEVTSEIPNGVNTEVFHPNRKSRIAEELAIPSDAKLILCVGNLIRLKGHHRVLAAVAHLVTQGINVHLVIMGNASHAEGQYSTFLRRLTAQLGIQGRVHFKGGVSPHHVADFMCAADVFCLASDREGCPNVVREALACGLPVVATRVGAVPQLIPELRYGVVVAPDNDVALQDALAFALSCDWDRQSISCWGASRSWENVADEVLVQMESALRP